MSVKFVIQLNEFGDMADWLKPNALKTCRRGANRIRTLSRRSMRASGRGQRTGRTGRRYSASRPGEPPGVITGELQRAMRVRRIGELTVQVDFGTGKGGLDHVARILEGGSARVAARPFFYQAVQNAAPQFEAEMAKVFEKGMSSIAGDDDGE